jgi:Hint domain
MTTRTFATYSTRYDINGTLTDGSTVAGYFVLQNVADNPGVDNSVSLLAENITVDGKQQGELFSYTYSLIGASTTVDCYIGTQESANDVSYATYTYNLVSQALTDTGVDGNQAYEILSLHFTSRIDDGGVITVDLTGNSELSYDAFSYDGINEVSVPFNVTATVLTPTESNIVCYAKGTMIATIRGPVRVEKLKLGEMILTLSGKYEPLKWLGFRTVDCKRHSNPTEANPIRIVKDAFGLNQPARDLYLSPLHSVYVDGILIEWRYGVARNPFKNYLLPRGVAKSQRNLCRRIDCRNLSRR